MAVKDLTDLPGVEYWIGDELDPLAIWWFGGDGALVPFASDAYSFTLSVVAFSDLSTAIFTKTAGFATDNGTGDGSAPGDLPNLTVIWDLGVDLNSVPDPGRYLMTIVAAKVAGGAERTLQAVLRMRERH